MAREYAQIRLVIWNDDDFRELSPAAQWLYFTLLTHPTLTSAGVGDWRPNRLAALSRGNTPEGVEAAGAELANRLYIVVDQSTEEYLVRSFHRNDDLLKMPNMATAAARAAAEVASSGIRGVLVHELKRLKKERPEMKGWGSVELVELMRGDAVDPSSYPCWNPSVDPSVKGSGNPSDNPSVYPSVDPSVKGDRIPSGNPSVNPSPSTATATTTLNTQLSTVGVEEVREGTTAREATFPPPQIQVIPEAWISDPGLARCQAHAGDAFPPPCGACADARRGAEAEAHRREREAEERKRARRTAIDACTLCDEHGWVLGVGGAIKCTHDEDTNAELVLKAAEAEKQRALADEERRQAAQAALEALGIRRPTGADHPAEEPEDTPEPAESEGVPSGPF